MNIILVGCGKVGSALTRRLTEEGHNVTVVDTSADKVAYISEKLDVLGVEGNGASITTLNEAGMKDADVLIAVTGSDELNLLCCMFAKKAGNCRCIARVRNPMYSRELEFIKAQLGISTIINPELAAAKEISRLLRFPAAEDIDTFAEGRVRLIRFELKPEQGLDGMALRDIPHKLGCDILICAVEREDEVCIPDGNFVLKSGDVISFVSAQGKGTEFFAKLHLPTHPVHNALLVGGGPIAYYLAKDLLRHSIEVRIIEHDAARCDWLAAELPGATILHGDGADRQFLQAEGLAQAEAMVALTDMDEENVMLAMYAKKHCPGKLVTKVNWLDFDGVLDTLDLGSVVTPKYIVCDFVIQYVRALQNSVGGNLKTLYRMLDDRVEALEFEIRENSAVTGTPLKDLKLKPGYLLCCITRGDKVIIPRGGDHIQVGDTVIVVTLEHGLQKLRDILAK